MVRGLWRGVELLAFALAVVCGGFVAAVGVTHVLAELGRRFGRDGVIDRLIKERGIQ